MKKETVLIVFPHAGGFAGYYSFIKQYEFHKVDKVILYEYPGRGERGCEESCQNITVLARKAYEELEDVMKNNHCILFGHSMGAFVAYELAKKYYIDTNKKIRLLIISGEVAPNQYTGIGIDCESEKAVCDYISSMGGTSKELLEVEEAKQFFVPIIQNDLRLASSYEGMEVENIECAKRICVLYGNEDYDITEENIEGWKEVGEQYLGSYVIDGDHFYLSDTEMDGQIKFLNHIDKIIQGTYDVKLKEKILN